MDDDNNQKTPTMKARQWVRVDIKYNSDVATAKQKFKQSLNNVDSPIISSYVGCFQKGFMAVWSNYHKNWIYIYESSSNLIQNRGNGDAIKSYFYDKCSNGLVYQLTMLEFARSYYKEIGNYFFDGLIGQTLSDANIDTWLGQNKFINTRDIDFRDFNEIVNIECCDSIENDVVRDNSFSNTISEELRLKLYYIITTKNGKKYKTDICIAFDDRYSSSPINDARMKFYFPNSLTAFEEV